MTTPYYRRAVEMNDEHIRRYTETRYIDGYEPLVGDPEAYIETRTRDARRFIRNLELRTRGEISR